MLFEPTLSIVDGAQHKCFVGRCQRRFSVHASTFVGFPGGAANSLLTLALQVRFSLFAQHVHNIYLAQNFLRSVLASRHASQKASAVPKH